MINTDSLTDEQLISLVREKDQELHGIIIRRYQTRLAHYLRKFIPDADALEDVLQEVFIKTYRNLYGFNVNKKFSPWIYRIAHNEALNHLKKQAKVAVSLDEKEWQIIDERKDVKEEVDASFTKKLVEKGLASLKEKYREPLILYFFEQKTYEEISDILRIPRSTVGTLILRGKSMLKQSLK